MKKESSPLDLCSKGHNNWYYSPNGKKRRCRTCWNATRRINGTIHQAKSAVRRRYKEMRLEVLAHYGGKCVCCGESRYEFLCMDHINGGGIDHRKKVAGSKYIYKWLIEKKFPDIVQILCHNCNMSKGFYGYCPHQKEQELAASDISEYYRQLAGWPS